MEAMAAMKEPVLAAIMMIALIVLIQTIHQTTITQVSVEDQNITRRRRKQIWPRKDNMAKVDLKDTTGTIMAIVSEKASLLNPGSQVTVLFRIFSVRWVLYCGKKTFFILGTIDCGTVEEKNMTIHHYGFGVDMYAVEDSTCKAVEGEGHHHFILQDVMTDSACTNVVHVCLSFKKW